jgi:RHS repeat-associated protein
MALSARHRRWTTAFLAAAGLACASGTWAQPPAGPGNVSRSAKASGSPARERWLSLALLLEDARRGTAGRARLEQALAALVSEEGRWRRQQDDIPRRNLPAKARERQARAQAAFAAGQGRLVQILRELLAPRSEAAPAATLADEALALVGRLELASRPESLSAAHPRVFAPALHPPALRAPTAAPLVSPAGDAPAPPETALVAAPIREQAALLDGPAAVYDWVRNEIRPDFYYGGMRGPLQAFLERRGNDADTAAVLIEMMRAQGIPARYVRGTVEVSAAALTALTGTAAIEQAVRVLERAGIPHQPVAGGGGVAAVRLERVWAEAYVPYANYRGTALDTQGKVWVPLDAAFKPLEPMRGFDVRQELGFAPRAAFDEYLRGVRSATPLASVRASVTALLAEQRPGVGYADALNRRLHIQQTLGLLPSSLPYLVRSQADVGYDLPADLVHTLRLTGEGPSGTLFSFERPLAHVAGRRLTLSYVPFSDDDRAVVASYGGLSRTPPYLIEVRPVLKADGLPLVSGDVPIGMAVAYTLHLEMETPSVTLAVSNRALAGNLSVIGLAGRAGAGAASEETAARILDGLARAYFQRWDTSDEELANLLRVAPVRPTTPACLVASDVEVDYAGGDPDFPSTFEWKGAFIDADLRASAPVALARDQAQAEHDFLLLSGLEGSVLEDRIFSDGLQVAAISTASALGLAAAQDITIHELTSANAPQIVPSLSLDPAVKAEVLEATARGLTVLLPAANVTQAAWTGVGYLLLDHDTGASAWQLQGGHSGGVTVPSVIDWPQELLDPLLAQGEDTPPAPQNAEVAAVVKFGSTDFQIGVVAKMLPKPLKVLVTDEAGQPIEGAQVTFRVLGGGGLLVDPVTGDPSDSLTVAANAHGEASAPFLLAKKTDPIPRYLLFEGDEFATQAGMNVVTATAGRLTLEEPFLSFALPDDQFDGDNRHATITNHSLNLFCAPLGACGPLRFEVNDQHGNPLSNIPLTFTYKPLPTQWQLPEGEVWLKPPTTTPLHLLKQADFAKCLDEHDNPRWGTCEGEMQSLTVSSNPIGVMVYGLVGDSMGSDFRLEAGSPARPDPIQERFQTSGVTCSGALPRECEIFQRLPLVVLINDARWVRINSLGNAIEAYAVGTPGDASFMADALIEEERVIKEPTNPPLFRAEGTNRWRREPLTDSEFKLFPTTPGTTVSPEIAAHVGNGVYSSQMTMGLDPQLNKIHATGKHYPPELKYLPYDPDYHLDPAYVTDGNPPTVRRVKRFDRPWRYDNTFELWGIAPQLTGFTPSPILLSSTALVTRESMVSHQIAPAPYAALLDPREVIFQVHRTAPDGTETQVLTAANTQPGGFRIPVGMPAPPGTYTGVLTIANANITTEARVDSPPRQVPICGVVHLKTPIVEFGLIRDPDNDVTCGHEKEMVFEVCWDSKVTVRVSGQILTASVDGSPPGPIEELSLTAGTHVVSLGQALLGQGIDTQAPFTVEAVTLMDPLLRDRAAGTLLNKLANRSVRPVGHVFVNTVDLLDGHVVRSSVDFTVPGRHLNLEVRRNYTSSGTSSEGAMGAGWSWTYSSGLYIADCGLATVVTADGNSETFRTGNGGVTYAPQKGYHSQLVRNDDLSYDFFDRTGRRHHFREPEDPEFPLGSRRLEYIEEPHGDRINLHYDGDGRVASVAEYQPERGEVRRLLVTYEPKGGSDRIKRIEIPELRLSADYQHDAFGNLTVATRQGDNIEGPDAEPRREIYAYSVANGVDRHQLLRYTGPNDEVTEYRYLSAGDPFLGEQAGRLFQPKTEYAKDVRERVDATRTQTTKFEWDYRDAAQLRYRNTVRDGRGHATLYVMDGRGSPHEIRDAAGKSTFTEWADDDILKTSETDANGRVTRYAHDRLGNLIKATIETSDMGEVVSTYNYGRCNKLALKVDAEGHHTSWTIDDRCDVLSHTDGAGNTTTYEYDADGHGLLMAEHSPRHFTTRYEDHNSFGKPLRATGPTGIVTNSSYDGRNRLAARRDSLGHETRTEYDGLDRPVVVERGSGDPNSADEVTYNFYYPGGQLRSTVNATGAFTDYTLDGLNRVTNTEVFLNEGQRYTTATRYDLGGNPEWETDRRGVTRHNTFDLLNRLRRVEIVSGPDSGPLGEVATFEYDNVGNKRSETGVAGLRTHFFYDGLYHLRRRVSPEPGPNGNYTEVTVHDKTGRLRSITDFNGNTTSHVYDGLNRVLSTTNAEGHVTAAAYDDPEGSHVNKSEEAELPRGLRTTFLYDALNREIGRTVHLEGANSAGETYDTFTAYDDDFHTATVSDPRQTKTRRRLNGLDRVVEEVVDAGTGGLNLTTTTGWDGLGNVTRTVDPGGHETNFKYDSLGRLIETHFPEGMVSAQSYDGGNLKTAEVDRRGVEKSFTHDNLGRPRHSSLRAQPQMSGVPWSEETRYFDRERKRIQVDARSTETVLALDGLERVTQSIDANGDTVKTRWDGVNKRAVTDKRGHTTLLDYDRVNRLTKTTDPVPFDAQTAETIYADVLNQRTEKDRNGIETITKMDPLGRVVSVTRAGARLEAHTYDEASNRATSTDAEGHKTRFAYDRAHRLVERTNGDSSPQPGITHYFYDDRCNQTRVQDQRAAEEGDAFSVERSYDGLHRVREETNGQAESTVYEYDGEGHRTFVREPEENETRYTHDETGQLSSVKQPPGPAHPAPLTRHGYDENRNRIRQTDARDKIVQMHYDPLNRLDLTKQDAEGLGLETRYHYDPNGNLRLLEDPNGQTVTSVYDELNRLKSKMYTFAPGTTPPWRHTTKIEYTLYDGNGNLEQVKEWVASGTDPPVAQVTDRAYDDWNRLLTETTTLPDGGTRTVSYTYYLNGARKSVTDPSGAETSYTYDGQGRLATATTAGGVTTYTYWPDDLLRTVAYPNGVVASYGYDKADRLLSLTNVKDGATLSSYSYTYSPNGNRLTQTETNGGLTETTSYTYDALNRLRTVTYPADTAFPQGRVVTYGYDAVGNRISEQTREPGGALLDSKQGTFDGVNRLTALADLVDPTQTVVFGYDRNGNQTRKQKGSAEPTLFTYDVRDKLVEVGQGTSILGRFQYDCDGRRTKKIGEEGIRQYVYDQTSLLAEYDEDGVQKAKYDYGSDRLISLTRPDEGRRFFSFDGLRSVTNLTDDTGSAVASYHLDAWGNFRFPSQLLASRNRFSFTGYLWDQETSLFFAKARFYDPEVGRFTSQDSYLGQTDDPPSLHRYFYANANPVRYVDPTGHATKAEVWRFPDDRIEVRSTEETTVYAQPTDEQLTQQLERGEISYDRAVLGQLSNKTRALATTTPDHQKSEGRNLAEDFTENFLWEVTSPAHDTFEGLMRQDPEQFLTGLGKQALAGAVPVVVKEGGSYLVDKLVQKVPALGDDIRQLGPRAYDAAKNRFELATQEAKRLLQAEIEFPSGRIGSHLGNIKIKLPLREGTQTGPKAGRYEFPDQKADQIPYVGQSGNIPRRLSQHEKAGRLTPGTETTTEVLGGKTAREVAEHKRIQELTSGVPASQSDSVSNRVDPIGPRRKHLLEEDRQR